MIWRSWRGIVVFSIPVLTMAVLAPWWVTVPWMIFAVATTEFKKSEGDDDGTS